MDSDHTVSSYLPGEVFKDTDEYDVGIRQIVPYYDETLDTMTQAIPWSVGAALELGSGTGELTLKLLGTRPHARVVCVDYSERMTSLMKGKIAREGLAGRVAWIRSPIEGIHELEHPLLTAGSFDACVSSFALHHLADADRHRLSEFVFTLLKPGGHFWIADTVLPEHDELTGIFVAARERWLSRQGLSRETMAERMIHDRLFRLPDNHNPGTTRSQLRMLEGAGFRSIEILWKYFGTAVFGGVR